jgi:hypothetical protein
LEFKFNEKLRWVSFELKWEKFFVVLFEIKIDSFMEKLEIEVEFFVKLKKNEFVSLTLFKFNVSLKLFKLLSSLNLIKLTLYVDLLKILNKG